MEAAARGCPDTAACPGHGDAPGRPCHTAELAKKGQVGGKRCVESQQRKGDAGEAGRTGNFSLVASVACMVKVWCNSRVLELGLKSLSFAP